MSSSLRPSPADSVHRNRRSARSSSPPCPRGLSLSSAAVDCVALVAIISACGFLLFPYAKILGVRSAGVVGAVGKEFREVPLVYVLMGISVLCASLATWAFVLGSFKGRKCSNPECRGLRNSVEFDIQLETEEDLRKEGSSSGRNLFELPMYQHKELEAELGRMAPPNGKAVLFLGRGVGARLVGSRFRGKSRPGRPKSRHL